AHLARAIGIDAEPHEPLPKEVLPVVASPGETAALRKLGEADGTVCWDRLLFSAKESVYKVWYPLTGRWLDFSEAVVDIEPSGSFRARLLVADPAPGTRVLSGRWAVNDGRVVTAIALPAPERP
ncbi:MAG: 4'-phosphopantetheinyl transferase superfamily protein, partial [Microbispora sp.]|nr:4'-phosphopantetheinyl transferase superfamily protein [Microbispora sp.]